MRRAIASLGFYLVLAVALVPSAQAAKRPRHRVSPPALVFCVETLQGQPVDSRQPDDPINPASVVKVATSLWALERLGPEFRFETRFFTRGTIDVEHRVLRGDLIVQGTGDPDFHVENAFLVAQALNDLKVERVNGALIVNSRFWIGWENGSAGRQPDPVKRSTLMAMRLRQALNPRRWDWQITTAWREYRLRRGLTLTKPPQVVIAGGVGADGDASNGEMLVVHRSHPLADILRRFNCFSNNDIERISASLGPIDELAGLVATRCDVPRDTVQLETASGLGSNRLTPRIIVRLLREFRQTAERLQVPVESLLPVAGCDPGTVTRFFPLLANGPYANSVIGKTGTLTNTDGGVAVLAGYANTPQGELVFCVAVPHASGKLRFARLEEERWVLDLLVRHGGGQPRRCAPLLSAPDDSANVILLGARVVPPAQPTPAAVMPPQDVALPVAQPKVQR